MQTRDLFPAFVAMADDARIVGDDFDVRLAALLDAGCPAIALRPRSAPTRALLAAAERAVLRCAEADAELWIHDRADIACAVGAPVLQLPGRGLTIAGARRVVGERVRIGRSVHGAPAARRALAEGAAQLVVGTIFATPSHPDSKAAGPERLVQVADAIGAAGERAAIYAIGGMTADGARLAFAAGVTGVVAIRALWDADDPAARLATFHDALLRGREEALDSEHA